MRRSHTPFCLLVTALAVPAAAAPPPPTAAPASVSTSPAPAPAPEPLPLRLRRFSDALAKGVARAGEHPRYTTVAVLPFGEHGERAARHDLGDLLSYTVRASLARDYGFPVVPPAAVREALKHLPEGAEIDADTATEAVQELRAKAVVVGHVSDGADHFVLSASVFAVGGGDAAVEHRLLRVSVPEMIAAAEEARILRTRLGALWRSSVAPGWGQVYNRQTLKGSVIAGAEGGLLVAALVCQILGARAEARYDWDMRKTVDELEAAEDLYAARTTLLVVAAGLWAYAAVDAYMGGADPDEVPTLAAAAPRLRLLPIAVAAGAGRPGFLGGVALVSF